MTANRLEIAATNQVSKFRAKRWRAAKGIVTLPAILAGAFFVLTSAEPASADEHFRGAEWRDRDIVRFHEHDIELWRHGRWFHGDHLGRLGWWWIVGGVWYFYPAPVYPYPDPYVPPGVVAAPGAVQYYYYCNRPHGYYPYVAVCRVPWSAIAVTAVPPPGAAIPPPSEAPPPGVVTPAPGPAIPSGPSGPGGQECKEYQSTVENNGVSEPVYGTICRQPDGTWRVVK